MEISPGKDWSLLTVVTGTRIEKHPNPPNVHQPLIEDFITAVLTDKDPAVTGEMGSDKTSG